MIVFLTLVYIGVLALLVWRGVIKLNLWWKLSPLAWMNLLLVALFFPMQWGAPYGKVNTYEYIVEIVPNVSGEVIGVPVQPFLAAAALAACLLASAARAADKPNVLVIWGDDIGTWNISHNHRGMMGYRTPNIDRLANGKTFRQQFGPRGVLKCKADGKGGQMIEDTGPLTRKRMETIDEESLAAAKDFITRKSKADEPFFCWWNAS